MPSMKAVIENGRSYGEVVMPIWKGIVGRSFNSSSSKDYISSLNFVD